MAGLGAAVKYRQPSNRYEYGKKASALAGKKEKVSFDYPQILNPSLNGE